MQIFIATFIGEMNYESLYEIMSKTRMETGYFKRVLYKNS